MPPKATPKNVVSLSKTELTEIISSVFDKAVETITIAMDTLTKNFNSAVQKIQEDVQTFMTSQVDEIKKTYCSELAKAQSEVASVEQKLQVLQQDYDALKVQTQNAMSAANEVGQYQRRWLVRLHGLKLEEEEHCINTAIKFFDESLGVKLQQEDIEAAHRLRPRNDDKPPCMIVRFQRRDKRQLVINARKKLKDSGMSIMEDLTRENIQLLNRVQNHVSIQQAWAYNGKIFGIPVGSKTRMQFHLFEATESTISKALLQPVHNGRNPIALNNQ